MPQIKEYQSIPSAIATYPYNDLADGTGTVLFSAFVTEDNSAIDYHLTKDETIYSTKVETTTYAGGSGDKEIVSFDFDLVAFNSPRVLQGVGNVLFSLANEVLGGVGVVSSYVVITLKNGATTIATATSPTVSKTGVGVIKELMNVPLIIPITQFKVGEILTLHISVWANCDVSTTGQVTIGHDPRNRNGTYIIPSTDVPYTITKLLFYCPFKVLE